jgi:hypothetical protein
MSAPAMVRREVIKRGSSRSSAFAGRWRKRESTGRSLSCATYTIVNIRWLLRQLVERCIDNGSTNSIAPGPRLSRSSTAFIPSIVHCSVARMSRKVPCRSSHRADFSKTIENRTHPSPARTHPSRARGRRGLVICRYVNACPVNIAALKVRAQDAKAAGHHPGASPVSSPPCGSRPCAAPPPTASCPPPFPR